MIKTVNQLRKEALEGIRKQAEVKVCKCGSLGEPLEDTHEGSKYVVMYWCFSCNNEVK